VRLRKNGFTLIEVLIAMVLLSSAIVVMYSAYKQYIERTTSLRKTEQTYLTALSLKDYISTIDLFDAKELSGTLNGIPYTAVIRIAEEKNSLIFTEQTMSYVNLGQFAVTLFQVDLTTGNIPQTFYFTRYRKLYE
jgi:prepilin-type N-terminal cleavage/methylation domain-containing protein